MAASSDLSVIDLLDRAREQAARFAELVDDPQAYQIGLERMAEILQEELAGVVDKTTAQWVGYLRHELAQPLAVLNGVVETLLTHDQGLDEDTRQKLYQRTHRQVLLMRRVLAQLDRAYRLDTDIFEVRPEQVDLEAAIIEVLEDYQPLFEPAGVEVERGDRPLTGCVEPAAFAEILVALLRNAVTHAPCEDPLLVEATRRNGTVRVSIHDDGAGIAEQERGRIFERGVGLDDNQGGLGLGLFVARSLARAHDGDLTVTTSERLGGARFDLVLPADC